jgi:plastocyanin
MPALRLLVVPVALCFAAACGSDSTGSSSAPPPPTGNATTDINIPSGASISGQFSPNPKNASLGGAGSVSIRWVNRDYSGTDYSATSVVHHIVSDDGAFSPSPNLGGNDTYTISLSAARDYPYHCSIHPNMQGTIHVTP